MKITKRFKISVIYFIVILCTVSLRVLSALDVYSFLNIDDSDLAFTLFVQLFVFGILPLSLYFLFKVGKENEEGKSLVQDFGMRIVGFKTVIYTILIAICMIVLSSGFSLLWQLVLYAIGYTRSSSSTDYSSINILIKELLITGLLPAVFEEFTNRGLLYAGYRKIGWKYVVISALLFSLMHQNIAQTGYTFLDGIIIALTMYYTGSLFMGILIHFINNGWVVIQSYAVQNPAGKLGFISKSYEYLTGRVLGLVISIIVIIICGFLLFALLKELRESAVKKRLILDMPFYTNKEEAPLRKDIFLWLTIIIGIGATVFSLVWGIMR